MKICGLKKAGLLGFWLLVLILGFGGAQALAAESWPQAGAAAGDWWLLRVHLSGEGAEDDPENKIREYRLAAADEGYALAEPYVPLRLLAELAGTPLSWEPAGECAIWGQRECAVVLPVGGRRLFYVLDAGAEAPYAPSVYEEEVWQPAFMWQGGVCLPLSLLERLGVGWDYTPGAPEAGELGVIDLYLGEQLSRGVAPELVWAAAGERVLAWRRPAAVLLGRGESYFDPGLAGRSQNIYLAAASLHGLVLQAGEEFSFNRAVGPRTAARGYQQAVIFVGRRQQLGLGGGICQVSSTLYQAVLAGERAGLEVSERHPHSLPVAYAGPGLDATVAWGSLDLRWRNNSGGEVYLICSVTEDAGEGRSRLVVEVWQGALPEELPELFAIE